MKSRIRALAVPVAGILFMVIYLLDVEYVASMRGLDLSWHVMLGHAYEKVAEEKFPFTQADFRVALTNVRAPSERR